MYFITKKLPPLALPPPDSRGIRGVRGSLLDFQLRSQTWKDAEQTDTLLESIPQAPGVVQLIRSTQEPWGVLCNDYQLGQTPSLLQTIYHRLGGVEDVFQMTPQQLQQRYPLDDMDEKEVYRVVKDALLEKFDNPAILSLLKSTSTPMKILSPNTPTLIDEFTNEILTLLKETTTVQPRRIIRGDVLLLHPWTANWIVGRRLKFLFMLIDHLRQFFSTSITSLFVTRVINIFCSTCFTTFQMQSELVDTPPHVFMEMLPLKYQYFAYPIWTWVVYTLRVLEIQRAAKHKNMDEFLAEIVEQQYVFSSTDMAQAIVGFMDRLNKFSMAIRGAPVSYGDNTMKLMCHILGLNWTRQEAEVLAPFQSRPFTTQTTEQQRRHYSGLVAHNQNTLSLVTQHRLYYFL